MSTPNQSGPEKVGREDREVTDVTCLGCGCLCDDLSVIVRDGQVVEVARACAIGRALFLSGGGRRPLATIDGVEVGSDAAIAEAARILAGASAPVVFGLSGSTLEAQRLAVGLADRIGGAVDHAHSSRARLQAIQRIGRVTATLGEVKNRADVVVFWACDPVTTHPRHLERYSVEPAGRFIPEGRAGRVLLVADDRPTPTSELADTLLPVADDRQFEVLWTLRALLRGVPLDAAGVLEATGLSLESLQGWLERLKAARYGVFFHDDRLTSQGTATVEAAYSLVRDLNAGRRFVTLGLGGPGNPAGAEAVLGWQAGFASAVSFESGAPTSDLGVTSARERLERGEADALLVLGDCGTIPVGVIGRIPTIVIGPDATTSPAALGASVAIDAARPGLEGGGTVARVDGVMLPLRPPLGGTVPTEADRLERLLASLPVA
ncbi:formylmethanofuran dehydrogenase subunit B [Isosphaeraceae bacterium EP7]